MLEEFASARDEKCPTIAKMWRAKWADITALFDFPEPIRKATYTTNATESVNIVIHNRRCVSHRSGCCDESRSLADAFPCKRSGQRPRQTRSNDFGWIDDDSTSSSVAFSPFRTRISSACWPQSS